MKTLSLWAHLLVDFSLKIEESVKQPVCDNNSGNADDSEDEDKKLRLC